MKRYYFSHMTRERLAARGIQHKIESSINLRIVNPFYSEKGIPTNEIAAMDIGESPNVHEAEIVGVDEKKVREADGVVAYLSLDIFTFGCPVEMYIAAMIGKPVYTISPLEKIRNHPFVKHYSRKVFENVNEFILWWEKNEKEN